MPDTRSKVQADPQAKSPQNALVYRQGVPYWDFSADTVAYPLTVEELGREYLAFFFLRQHTDLKARKGFSQEYKRALREAALDMKMQGDTVEIPPLHEAPMQAFVTEHFSHIGGLIADEADLEKHRRWLDQRPWLKTRLFREGVQKITVKENVDEEETASTPQKLTLLDVDLDPLGPSVTLRQTLYSPKKDRLEEVILVHLLKPGVEADYREWRKARTSKYNTRRRLFTAQENYDKLESIYARSLADLTGGLFFEQPFAATDSCVQLIPLEHKLLVLDTVYAKTQEKNV